MPRWRSQSAAIDGGVDPAGPSSVMPSRTRKSLPVACELGEQERGRHRAPPLPAGRAARPRGILRGGPEPGDAGIPAEPHPLAAGEGAGCGGPRCVERGVEVGLLAVAGGRAPPGSRWPGGRCGTSRGSASSRPAPRRPGPAAAHRRRSGPRSGPASASRGSHDPGDRSTGNTVGPYSPRPGPNDENGRPVSWIDLERAHDAAAVVRLDAGRGVGVGPFELARTRPRRRPASAVARLELGPQREVLAREARGRRRPPARRGRCRRRAARACRALSMSATAARAAAWCGRPTSPRRARRRRPGGAGPRPARPGVGFAVPMSMPRYTCIESSETISTSPSAARQARARAPTCPTRSARRARGG